MQKSLLSFLIIGFVILLISLSVSQSPSWAMKYFPGTQLDMVVYVPLVPKKVSYQPGTTGDVAGTVRDSRTKGALKDVQVCYNDTICDDTDDSGKYLLQDLPNGNSELTAQLGGYSTGVEFVFVQPNQTIELDFQLLPVLDEDEIRVVLTWDDTPSWLPESWPNDLNLHLWTNYEEPHHHIYIGNLGNCSDLEVLPHACYESEEQYGSGPDTIVLSPEESGDYIFGVLNYNDERPGVPPLTELDACVQIFDFDGLVDEICVPPTGEGDLWMVFNLSFGEIEWQSCLVQYILPGDKAPSCP